MQLILKYIKKGKESVNKALDFMFDLGLTNEHLKEHLMYLCMDTKIQEAFESLEPSTKAAFTREYNKQHRDDITKTVVKGGKKKAAAVKDEDDEEEDEATQMMDEEQKIEIKKGKKLEKQQEAKAQQEKMSGDFEILKVQKDGTAGKKGTMRKSAGGAKRAPAKKKSGKKGGKKGDWSDDEGIASDDSLNDFIVEDEDAPTKKKKKK